MPHELEGQVHWHEPAGLEPAGRARFPRPETAYDRWMAGEGVPVWRGVSVALDELPLGDWPRLGGRGGFVQPFGSEAGLGMHVVALPGGGLLRPERHLFDKVMLVLAGRGTTELDRADGGTERFEWQEGTLFSLPLNARHRLVNAGSAPARLLAATTAPAAINLLGARAVFGAGVTSEGDASFAADDDVMPDPVQDLALCRTRLVPDVLGCDLPLDNRLSPGWRQLRFEMTQAAFPIVIGQHRPGRYGRAVLLEPGSAVLALGGTGDALLWPERLGPTPWADGTDAAVRTVPWRRFTLLGAGPGGGRWFLQVFPADAAPLRLAWFGGALPQPGTPGDEQIDPWSLPPAEGGAVLPYWAEDPSLRVRHAAAMAACGAINRMREAEYRAP
jgi:quercetin dioxygenase-like cupin family protein